MCMKNIKNISVLFIASFLLLTGCENNGDSPKQDTYYSISYIPNGGSGNIYTESVKKNTDYELLSCMFTPPSQQVFNAWVIDNASYQPGEHISVSCDIDVIATYKDEGITGTTYTITFDPNTGTGYMAPEVIEKGFSYVLPQSTFTPPLGYDFDCWGIDGVGYKPGRSITVNEDLTLVAYYKKNGKETYTVSFNANGGSGSMESIEVEEGLYYLPSCTFTAPSNKTFDYWSISTGSTHYQANQPINVTSDVVVTANWKNLVPNKYTVSFNANGGSGSMSSVQVEENTWYYLPDCSFTPPSGYEFDYWRVNGTSKYEGEAIKITDNITAYAEYKEKEAPLPEWEDDKYKLECGSWNMGVPLNASNPVEIRTTLSSDSSSWFNSDFKGDVSNGYRYIYKNSCSDMASPHYTSVKTYATSHDGGGLKINDIGVGFGSPYFAHTGKKLELRIGISSVNNSSGKKEANKDTFHIYYFGANNVYLGKSSIEEGSIKSGNNPTKELKVYYQESNAEDVRYFEFRCNALPYIGSQCYNVGIGYCNVKSWERAS